MYKNINEVTIESLKKEATKIHFFGLGFIQIKLGDTYRIHFYEKNLPTITPEEDVHNHRYNFTSHIFAGTFEQEIFEIIPGNDYRLEYESCKEGVLANEPSKPCSIKSILKQRMFPGSSYVISHEVFHRVKSEYAITFLERGPVEKEFAQVVYKNDSIKVCPFSKKVDEDQLWNIVEEMLNKAKSNAHKQGNLYVDTCYPHIF